MLLTLSSLSRRRRIHCQREDEPWGRPPPCPTRCTRPSEAWPGPSCGRWSEGFRASTAVRCHLLKKIYLNFLTHNLSSLSSSVGRVTACRSEGQWFESQFNQNFSIYLNEELNEKVNKKKKNNNSSNSLAIGRRQKVPIQIQTIGILKQCVHVFFVYSSRVLTECFQEMLAVIFGKMEFLIDMRKKPTFTELLKSRQP